MAKFMDHPIFPKIQSRCLALLGACGVLLAPASAEFIRMEGGMPESLPKLPFELPIPVPEDSREQPIKAEVLARASAEALFRGSSQFRRDDDLARAIFLRTQAYKKNPSLGGKLELARWCVEAKDVDSAIYWLQQAALGDHLDGVTTDEAFQPVRDDPRWAELKPFLTRAEESWKASSYWRAVLVTPSGYHAGKPIPVLMTLHGWGSVPEDFVDDPAYQELADELQIAVVGISGTQPEGKHRFAWKEKFEEDWKHIQAIMKQMENKIIPDKGRCLSMGFSQGGQLSAELVAAHPEMFAGAIVMGPGYRGRLRLPEALQLGGKDVERGKFIVTYNRDEHPGTVAAGKSMVQILRNANAEVYTHAFNGDTHSSPPYLDEHLSIWVQFLLSKKE